MVTEEEQPGFYWMVVSMQLAISGFLVLLPIVLFISWIFGFLDWTLMVLEWIFSGFKEPPVPPVSSP